MGSKDQKERETDANSSVKENRTPWTHQSSNPPPSTATKVLSPLSPLAQSFSPKLHSFPPPRPSPSSTSPCSTTYGVLPGAHEFHTETATSAQRQLQLPIRQRSPQQMAQTKTKALKGTKPPTATKEPKALKPPKGPKSSKVAPKSYTPRSVYTAAPPLSGIPEPSIAYNDASCVSYQILEQPQHLLVVIDLNGTLLHRPMKKSPTRFTARPHTPRFLNYCISTFTVVIWSSARPENVEAMCKQILPASLRDSVVAIWGRDKFRLTPEEYNNKVQCYKRLSTVWNDNVIKRSHPDARNGRTWNQTNTVLVDDSLYKGRSEPFNLIQIPEFSGKEMEREGVLPQVHDYLNRLSMCSNVSNYLKQHPFTYQAILA